MNFVKAVIDESKPTKLTPLLCVGGYAFDSNAALDFHVRWGSIIGAKKVPFFHRVDMLGPRNEMAHLSQQEADELQSELIKLVRELSMFGFAVVLEPAEFESALGGYVAIRDDGTTGPPPTAYAFACMICLILIRRWIEKTDFVGEVAYVFEAGHEDEVSANTFIRDEIQNRPRARRRHKYGGHGFRDKRSDPTLQAADLIAWHTAKMYVQRAGGYAQRPDTIELFQDREQQDRLLRYKTPEIISLRDTLIESGHIKKI